MPSLLITKRDMIKIIRLILSQTSYQTRDDSLRIRNTNFILTQRNNQSQKSLITVSFEGEGQASQKDQDNLSEEKTKLQFVILNLQTLSPCSERFHRLYKKMIHALSSEFKTSRRISNRQLKIPEISLDSEIFMGLATFEDIDRKFNKFASFSTSKASFSKKLLESQETASFKHQNSTLKSKDSFSLGKVTFKLPSGSSFKPLSCERKNSVSSSSNADTTSAEGKLHTPRNFSDSVHRVLFKETKVDQQDSKVVKESALSASASANNIRLQKSFSIQGQTPRMSLFELTNIQRSIQQNKNISSIRSGLEQMNNESISSSMFNNPTLDSLSTFIYEFANTTIGQINVQSPPNVERILMALGIQRSKFISLPSSKDKEKWIVSSIQRNCKEQLDQLLQKISTRTQQSLEQEVTEYINMNCV